MKRLILLPVLGIAACHQAPTVSANNASAGEVAAKVAAAGGPSQMAPGHYDLNYKVTKVDVPAMPQAASGVMQSMGKGVAYQICMTPEEAAKPAASMFSGGAGMNCTYDHFSMSTGAMDAKMTCKQGPVVAVSSVKGSFAADGFHMDLTTDSKGVGPMGSMTMAATIDAKRTGPCTGKEAS